MLDCLEPLIEQHTAGHWRNVITQSDGRRYTGIYDHPTKQAALVAITRFIREFGAPPILIAVREGVIYWYPQDKVTQEYFD